MSDRTPPCDCIENVNGVWIADCCCSNRGDGEGAAVWAAQENSQDEITRLRAEVERLGRDYQTARDAHDNLVIDNEKLRDEVRVWVAHTKKAVWSDSEECKFLDGEVTRLVKSRNRWAQKYNDLLNKKRAEDGYDVYAAAREEYRKKIAEQGIEVERLRAALKEIESITVHSGGDIHGISAPAWQAAFNHAHIVARAALGDTHE